MRLEGEDRNFCPRQEGIGKSRGSSSKRPSDARGLGKRQRFNTMAAAMAEDSYREDCIEKRS